jgi:hypothetical protein
LAAVLIDDHDPVARVQITITVPFGTAGAAVGDPRAEGLAVTTGRASHAAKARSVGRGYRASDVVNGQRVDPGAHRGIEPWIAPRREQEEQSKEHRKSHCPSIRVVDEPHMFLDAAGFITGYAPRISDV